MEPTPGLRLTPSLELVAELGRGAMGSVWTAHHAGLDAKVADTAMVRSFRGLSGILDIDSPSTGFWMLYGTPHVKGKPFIWSESLWNRQPLRDVPDSLGGVFTLMPLYLR